ncbi:MAG TPA: hypothetical protein VFV94_09775, partial [Polyangiaceae bacterium]|nr:hypothetical protein [Polyangiaceae bacterium]
GGDGSSARAGAGPSSDDGGTSSVGGRTGASGSASGGGSSTIGGSTGIGGSIGVGGLAGMGGPAIGDFDEPPEGACLETLSPYDRTSPTDLDVSWSRAPELLALDHHAPIAWADGTRSEVTLSFVGVSAYYVESTRNPDLPLEVTVNCENHVRLIATGRLTSADGRLDETLPEVSMNVGTATLSGQGPYPGLHGVTTLERGHLRGSYAPATSDEHCLSALEFEVALLLGTFVGSIREVLGSEPCGTQDSDQAVLGRVAATWECLDDGCASNRPQTALVVEAESCEGIGTQLTGLGEESSFTRSGDALVRREDYGCGCELYASFVMAWSFGSPVELRLCSHESRNACLAACFGEQTYDLSAAFRATGSMEFRFVE